MVAGEWGSGLVVEKDVESKRQAYIQDYSDSVCFGPFTFLDLVGVPIESTLFSTRFFGSSPNLQVDGA